MRRFRYSVEKKVRSSYTCEVYEKERERKVGQYLDGLLAEARLTLNRLASFCLVVFPVRVVERDTHVELTPRQIKITTASYLPPFFLLVVFQQVGVRVALARTFLPGSGSCLDILKIHVAKCQHVKFYVSQQQCSHGRSGRIHNGEIWLNWRSGNFAARGWVEKISKLVPKTK